MILLTALLAAVAWRKKRGHHDAPGEAAAALRLVMDRGAAGGVYNVGSGRPVRMKALLARLLAEAGVPYSAVEAAPQCAGSPGVNKIYADITRLKKLKSAPERKPAPAARAKQ